MSNSALESAQQVQTLIDRGKYALALPLAEELLTAARSTLGDRHVETVQHKHTLATILRALSSHARAKELAEEALSARRDLLGDDDSETAESFHSLGAILRDEGDLASAEAHHQQGLDIQLRRWGEKHPKTLSSLHDLALVLQDRGNYVAAQAHFERVVGGMQVAHGDNHRDTANSRNTLAECYWLQGNYTAAAREFELALSARRVTLGNSHPDTASTLNGLGSVRTELGQYQAARHHLDEALSIDRETFGDAHPETATTLSNLAILFASTGDIGRAHTYLADALKIRQQVQGPDHINTAHTHDNLGAVLQEAGKYSEARYHLDRALAIRAHVLGDEHTDTLTTLSRLATLLDVSGSHEEARDLHERVLEARRRTLGVNDPGTYASLNNLGRCLLALGDYSAALARLEEALAVSQTVYGDEHAQTATTRNNLGVLYGDMGDLVRATESHTAALQLRIRVLGPKHYETAESHNNLAGVLRSLGNASEARSHYDQAISAYSEALGLDHPVTAACLSNAGLLLSATGDFDAAEYRLQQALEIRRRTLPSNHRSIANSLHNIGNVRLMRGDLLSAQVYLENALEVGRKALGDFHSDVGATLSDLMCVYAGMGVFDRALQAGVELAQSDDHQISQVFAVGSDRQRTAVRGMVRNHLEASLSLVQQHLSGQAEAVRFAFDLVLRRKALGIEALIVQREALNGERYRHLGETLGTLTQLRSAVAAAAFSHTMSRVAHPEGDLRDQWADERERLEEALARQIPEMSLTRGALLVEGRTIAAALSADTVLLEFVRHRRFDFGVPVAETGESWQDEEYSVFVVAGGRDEYAPVLIRLGDAQQIDDAFQRYYVCLSTPPERRPVNNLEALGEDLRLRIIDPVRPHIERYRELVISPDSTLNRLSFAALPTEYGGMLIDRFLVSYVSVGRDVAQFNRPPGSNLGNACVVADPAFNLSIATLSGSATGVVDSPADESLMGCTLNASRNERSQGRRFGPLRGSRQEGERIAELLGVTPLIGAQALDGVIKRMRSPRVLHLATHGFFLPAASSNGPTTDSSRASRADPIFQNPLLRSGLALAGANVWMAGGELPEAAEDGLLNAEDVTGMDLADTELVVLSACESGLGDIDDGEGVFGLRRSFILAGAKRLVMSLWKVPDQETRELMLEFYAGVLRGTSVSAALRAAQEGVRAGKHGGDPYYWAAFIIQGDPAPIRALP